MKILVCLGSMRGNLSQGYTFIKRVQEILKDKNIEFLIYQPQNAYINFCTGCMACFLGGQCTQQDDIHKLKKAMLDADVIIFVSPVYAHNISATLKNLIDRMSFMTHYMPLIGKAGYIASVSNNNGNALVNDYLLKIFDYWGISCQKTISLQEKADEKVYESYAIFLAEELERLNRKFNIEATARQEQMFQKYTERYKTDEKNSPDAYRWKTQGYFEFKSIKDVLDYRVGNSEFTYII